MNQEEIKTEIEELEERAQWLLERGLNDEEVNSRLRELKNKIVTNLNHLK